MNQIVKKIPAELTYLERSVFMKDVSNHKVWNFELGTEENVNNPIWIIFVFQQQDKQDSQNLNGDIFVRLPVVSAQAIMSEEKHLMLVFCQVKK